MGLRTLALPRRRRAADTRRGLSWAAAITALCILVPAWLVSCAPTPPETPRLLDESGRETLQAALAAADRQEWGAAFAAAERVGTPLAASLIEWRRLQDPEADISFTGLAGFLEAHPDWPGREALIRLAEEWMPAGFGGPAARAWFARYPPRTGPGMQRFAELLIADGEEGGGGRLLRQAWAESDFPGDGEEAFLIEHGAALGIEDHELRLDRLLWDERTDAARRLLALVGEDRRLLAEARLALMADKADADAFIGRVPQHLRGHPGLVLEHVRWRRRTGDHAGARALLLDAPPASGRPGKWWHERRYQIREALGEGAVEDAYALALGHGHSGGLAFAEGEWLAGWLALRFLDRPLVAGDHFRAMYGGVRYPTSRARAAYWAGRSAEAGGSGAEAADWYKRAAGHPTTFYGQMAGLALDALGNLPPGEPAVPAVVRDEFEARPAVQAARMLGEVGDLAGLERFVVYLSAGAGGAGEHALIGRMGLAYGAPHLSVKAAKRASLDGVSLIEAGYPLVFGAEEAGGAGEAPELALMLGLARQESGMDLQAVSRAGARGLVQLMPGTAERMSRELGIPYSLARLTEDAAYNVTLGGAYLSRLLARYDGAYVPALAAYNAGPSRVDRWLLDWGDPREGEVDTIDWMESIPYRETRNYVQRVLEGAQVYRHRLNGDWRPADIRLLGPPAAGSNGVAAE